MREYSLMDFVYEIDTILDEFESDAEKAMKGTIKARRRVRDRMLRMIFIGNVIRDKIALEDGANRKRNPLEDAIKREEEKIERAIARYERKREEIKRQQENGAEEEK